MHTYQLTGEAKIVGCLEFIDTLLEAGIKFILFAHHLSVLDAFEAHVKKKDVEYIRIDGSVSSEKRHMRVQEFQKNEEVKIAILSLMACSQGITLTAASTVVFAELHWTPSLMN